MVDLRLPVHQSAAIESILQSNLSGKMSTIDTEITADTIVLRVPVAANYYRGPTLDLALVDTLPAIVLSWKGLVYTPRYANEKLREHQWELQFIEQSSESDSNMTPQEVLEERLSRSAVAILQVFQDNLTLTVSGVQYASALIVDRVVPTEEAITEEGWVRGVSIFFSAVFGHA